MLRTLTIVVAAALALAAAGATAGGARASTDPYVVDFGNCAFGTGTTTAPAGQPITLTDTGSSATGNYGTALHAFSSFSTSVTIAVTGGTTTTMPLAATAPQFIGDPFFAWLSFLPDISLDPLAPGGSVLVTIDSTSPVGGEIVFPGQKHGAPHFGPFHYGPGETDETQCLITVAGS